jgi:activator of HSP90 ATPase
MPPEVTRKGTTAFKKERAMNKRSLNTGLLSGGRLSRRESLATIALTFGGLALGTKSAFSATNAGISYSAATIHQEPVFAATPRRVFDALTDEKQFQKVQLLSAASKALDLVSNPAEISREAGGAIKLYGGYISGWQLELEPETRIVEAWRSASWPAHIYSIAKFELIAAGAGTKIVFDQTGFPPNEAEHLAAGWKSNYWDALTKYLA